MKPDIAECVSRNLLQNHIEGELPDWLYLENVIDVCVKPQGGICLPF